MFVLHSGNPVIDPERPLLIVDARSVPSDLRAVTQIFRGDMLSSKGSRVVSTLAEFEAFNDERVKHMFPFHFDHYQLAWAMPPSMIEPDLIEALGSRVHAVDVGAAEWNDSLHRVERIFLDNRDWAGHKIMKDGSYLLADVLDCIGDHPVDPAPSLNRYALGQLYRRGVELFGVRMHVTQKGEIQIFLNEIATPARRAVIYDTDPETSEEV